MGNVEVTFEGVVSVVGDVERGGYGTGPVPVPEEVVWKPVRSVCEFVKERGLVPVGTGSDTLEGGVSPLGPVERGGYGTGPVPEATLL